MCISKMEREEARREAATEKIQVMAGVRFKPEHLIERLGRKKRFHNLLCRHVSTLYSPCWIFEFRVLLQASKQAGRYAGYYAGVDEINMAPGKIQILPGAEEREVSACTILKTKSDEKQAVNLAWDYNKNWITIKYKNLYAPPALEEYKTHLYYKILYLMEFYNKERDEKKYMVLDSLTGDLEQVTELE